MRQRCHPPAPPLAVRRPQLAAWSTLPAVLAALLLGPLPASAADWTWAGNHRLWLHPREGAPLALGSVSFSPTEGGRYRFALALAPAPFKDFFLSMKEFKCAEGKDEIFCHVPYPYPQPGTVSAGDLAWLEHSLLFMFKTPRDFGAKLWNGVYFKLSLTATGLEGSPQAIDLNHISAPPDRPELPPYRPALRDDIAPGARWFGRLSID